MNVTSIFYGINSLKKNYIYQIWNLKDYDRDVNGARNILLRNTCWGWKINCARVLFRTLSFALIRQWFLLFLLVRIIWVWKTGGRLFQVFPVSSRFLVSALRWVDKNYIQPAFTKLFFIFFHYSHWMVFSPKDQIASLFVFGGCVVQDSDGAGKNHASTKVQGQR